MEKTDFCRDCFRKEGGGAQRRVTDHHALSAQQPDKPAYHSTRVDNDEVTRQLKELNEKMDRILDALTDEDNIKLGRSGYPVLIY